MRALSILLAAAVLLPAAARAQDGGFAASLRLGAAGIASQSARLQSRMAGEKAASDPTRTLPTALGTWKVLVKWTSDPMTGEDVLHGRPAFMPDPARCPACRSIRLVQVARVEVKPGQDYDWTSGEANRNKMRFGGFFVDHDANKCAQGAPCSPYYRDSWPLPDESQDGSNTGGKPVFASLSDYPYGWTQFQRITLETCARCVDTGRFLGCVRWGGEWPETGDRSFVPLTASDAPSAEFLGALRAFQSFYAMTPRLASNSR
ncbi:MAG: hypothetical protein KGL53_09990 [Elusimicrobia bacterium]|nr:hypothetical protein [Elusimicrobiota bacterium]